MMFYFVIYGIFLSIMQELNSMPWPNMGALHGVYEAYMSARYE